MKSPWINQFNFKPRYNNKADDTLVLELHKMMKELGIKRSALVRTALTNLVISYNEEKK